MYRYIHHSVHECIALCLNLFLGKFKTFRQIKLELLKLLNCHGNFWGRYFGQLPMLFLRANDLSSKNVVNATQAVQRIVVIRMQCAENMG